MRVLSPLPTPVPPQTEAVSTMRTSTKTPGIALNSPVPTVLLDTNVVGDNMAARLCISFLGHVLFLKNQIPFPVVQLAKMPTTDNTSRALKKRHELLNSFDTLASHLYTTFIALSTALALRGSPDKAGSEEALRNHGIVRAFLTVALGPTVGTAKSRVIVGIDGLETKVWGLREAIIPDNALHTGDASEEDEEDSLSEDESDEDEECEDEEGSEEEEALYGSDDDVSPPPSRSPSPSSESDASGSVSPSLQTEDPETVRAAERLLSRTLASACAEEDDHGLASEMAPTQIHVLLRAPRRFSHPCWVPRQNLCSSLDGYLADFLVESGEPPIYSHVAPKQRTKASKVQGVWVKSRESAQTACSEENLAEEDELIWWCWDGKLVGFTDW